jgi:hypothetical protein
VELGARVRGSLGPGFVCLLADVSSDDGLHFEWVYVCE